MVFIQELQMSCNFDSSDVNGILRSVHGEWYLMVLHDTVNTKQKVYKTYIRTMSGRVVVG